MSENAGRIEGEASPALTAHRSFTGERQMNEKLLIWCINSIQNFMNLIKLYRLQFIYLNYKIYALFWYVNKADSIRILREEFITKNFKNPQKWEKDYQGAFFTTYCLT